MTVTAADLGLALSCVDSTLRPTRNADWTRPAGELDWDCRQTAEHVGDVLMSYAAQVLSRPQDHYVRFLAKADEGASPAELLEFALTGGRLLQAAVAISTPETRAFHPTGMADPAGFAAMGCAELLLHGDDLALGLGTELDPPREVCARVVARLFPDEAPASDPWDGLRWCTGRIALPGRSRRTEWKWRGAPPA